MIWVTGDYHAGQEAAKLAPETFPAGSRSTRGDYLIILGDLGLPWSGSEHDLAAMGALAAAPWTTLFIDGNHERFDYLGALPSERWHGGLVQRVWWERPLPDPATGLPVQDPAPILHLMRGQVYDLDDVRIFCMGGASSIDAQFRVEGESWFAQELPTAAEYEGAERNLARAGWQVDYVLTHCCATSMLPFTVYPNPRFQALLTNELTDWLDGVKARLRYKRWYFGHHHYTRDKPERQTLLFNGIVPLGMSVEEARAAGQLQGLPDEKGY